ncbi:hypothetical protein Q8A73_014555 [Channa argus]|nr:hypothetical protein Q8A73_014555 [Channa argus]
MEVREAERKMETRAMSEGGSAVTMATTSAPRLAAVPFPDEGEDQFQPWVQSVRLHQREPP